MDKYGIENMPADEREAKGSPPSRGNPQPSAMQTAMNRAQRRKAEREAKKAKAGK